MKTKSQVRIGMENRKRTPIDERWCHRGQTLGMMMTLELDLKIEDNLIAEKVNE